MVQFLLNNISVLYEGDENRSLLNFLRLDKHLTATKDGCSGQGACGACTVEVDGKAKLACTTKMKSLNGATIFTMEGLPESVKNIIAETFVERGAVQCGFCSAGFIMRAKILLQENANPTRDEIQKAIRGNLCRCTGYKKIEEAIEISAKKLQNKNVSVEKVEGKVGESYPKYESFQTAVGERKFVDDLFFEGMLFGVLKFSEHPRAKILKIDFSKAEKVSGVHKIFSAKDILGKDTIGLIYRDWKFMIAEGEITNCISDVLAVVVAESEEIARKAANLIDVQYEILPAVTDVFEAMNDFIKVHPNKSNVLDVCKFQRGNLEEAKAKSKFISQGKYETQRIEHAFLECESAVAVPENHGIHLFSQGQGIYEDRRQVAEILNLSEEKVHVTLVANGGGFGGKEDLTVQGFASLCAFLLQKPVKVRLSRSESIRMHPKRHPVFMNIEIGADENGMLTFLTLRAAGDTGAYASVGTKVLERVAGHATGGYFVPNIDIEAKTLYTNNIPSGAMRGFGANQVVFALESCIDEVCEKGNFDRWQFRWNNALVDGLMTATGQKVVGVGIRKCLEALKEKFYSEKFTGIACGIKNSGIGNGMVDFCDVKIEIKNENEIILQHGWTEMGQGAFTIAQQVLFQETGIKPENVKVIVDTESNLKTGMTTSSRATVLLGNAIIDAAKKVNNDLKIKTLRELSGNIYFGNFKCDWTTKPGDTSKEIITHYSYGYAAQLCVLDEKGKIKTFLAAHDAGKVMNKTLFEGQVEGAVHMGIGYALTEELEMENGYLKSDKLKDCKILRSDETPEIVVIPVEVFDPVGPYGAKGVGEIGLVPTAAAVANALYQFDKIRRYRLPMKRGK